MCDPLTLTATALAVSAASTVAGFVGQQQQKKANDQAANVSYANNYNDLQQRNVQIDANQSESTLNNLITQRQNAGRISSSASAFGIDNATASGLFQANDFGVGRDQAVSDLNSQNQRLGSDSTGRGLQLQHTSDINRVAAPSPLALALNLGKDVVQAGQTYHDVGGKF